LNRIGSRINRAGDVRAVPVHYDRHVIALCRAGAPIAGPGTRQRVTFLCESQYGQPGTRAKATQEKETSTHGPQYSPMGFGAQR
jgi:hypothetical protein